MKRGGAAPKICYERFTSYDKADKALVKYLTRRDPRNLAIYPSKGN